MDKKGVNIFSLKGKNALITGATGYLGMSMAYIFAEAGANVIINSRTQEHCDDLVKTLNASGYAATSAVFDVTSLAEIMSFSELIQGEPIHVLVNNAYVGGSGSIEFSESENYGESYDVSVIAAHRLLKSILPNLRSAVQDCGDASVINLSSMYGIVSPDQSVYESVRTVNPPFYGAAKAALLQWTRYAACEFGKEGIRVNAVSPGPFPSLVVQTSRPNFIEKLSAKVPMGRIGMVDEIKGPMLFLASTAASYVNGANIVVDGGWTCW